MNVVVVSSKYPPEYSGSGLRAHRTHVRLREKYGINSEVICSGIEYRSPETYFENDLRVQRVVSQSFRSIHSLFGKGPIRRLTNAAVFRSEMNLVDKVLQTKNPDVLHVFGYSPATMAAIGWARIHNIPLMRELVNVVASPYQYPPGQTKNPSYEYPDQSVVVAISAELGKTTAKAGLTNNVWVRPNPVDLDRFRFTSRFDRDDSRKRLTTFSAEDRVIVFVSKFRQSKNHAFLIDVLAELPIHYKLLLAGPPSDPADPQPGLSTEEIWKLQDRAAARGLSGRLIVKPEFVDAADYMRAGDVFCMPAEKEAMGTPLLEALCLGLPVVANASEPSFREWIIDGENGYLRNLDASAWARAVLKTERFTSSHRESMASRIQSIASQDVIDETYYKLLSALSRTLPGEDVVIDRVINEPEPEISKVRESVRNLEILPAELDGRAA